MWDTFPKRGTVSPVAGYPRGVRNMVKARDRIVNAWTCGELDAQQARVDLEGLVVRHRGSMWRIQPGMGGARLVEVRPDGDVVTHPDPPRRRIVGWVLLAALAAGALWGFWDSSASATTEHRPVTHYVEAGWAELSS